jgi:ornithine cyclodeaminase
VCCATNSSVPVVWASQLRGRVHVNAIGSYRAAMRELAPDVLAQASQIVVDRIEAANAEAGEIIDALATGVISQSALIEFGRLLMEPPREPAGLTVFKSVGVAVQDWAIAELLRTRLADGSPDGNGIGPEDLSLSGEPA